MRKHLQDIIRYISSTETSILIFLIFIFALPFKARMEIPTELSFIDGRFIDYLTVSLYGFEILLIISLIAWVVSLLIKRKSISVGNKKIFLSIIAIFFFGLVSVFFSASIGTSIYYLVVFLELIFSYLFIVNKFKNKSDLLALLNVFLFSILLQSIIAIVQFIINGSVGLGLFGESILSPVIDGVAKTVFFGVKHIRSYGTFPHANVLAIYLTIAGLVNIYLFSLAKDKNHKKYFIISFLLIVVTLFLTFSRIAWLVALVLWGFYIIKIFNFQFSIFNLKSRASGINKTNKPKAIALALVICLVVGIIICLFPAIWWRINPALGTTWESWQIRFIVIKESLILFKEHWWGIGIGNFIIELANLMKGYPTWMTEPVHNTFLLVLVELGIGGFLALVALVVSVFKSFSKIPLYLKLIFLAFFVFMFFDHGFWDIRQTQYLLFIFIGMISLSTAQE